VVVRGKLLAVMALAVLMSVGGLAAEREGIRVGAPAYKETGVG
jgi:hypothetical protein